MADESQNVPADREQLLVQTLRHELREHADTAAKLDTNASPPKWVEHLAGGTFDLIRKPELSELREVAFSIKKLAATSDKELLNLITQVVPKETLLGQYIDQPLLAAGIRTAENAQEKFADDIEFLQAVKKQLKAMGQLTPDNPKYALVAEIHAITESMTAPFVSSPMQGPPKTGRSR